MNSPDVTKLDAIIDKEGSTPTERILFRDVFAVACYLHKIGERQAGSKVITTLFEHLGQDMRKTYFRQLLENIEGNQERFALNVGAHLEVNELFRSEAYHLR